MFFILFHSSLSLLLSVFTPLALRILNTELLLLKPTCFFISSVGTPALYSSTHFSLRSCLAWLLLLSLFSESFLIFLIAYESSVSVDMACSRFSVELSYFTPKLSIKLLQKNYVLIVRIKRENTKKLHYKWHME